MEHYVVQDQFGYWEVIEATSCNDATRRASNLDEDADLAYASSFCIGKAIDFSETRIAQHNHAIARDI